METNLHHIWYQARDFKRYNLSNLIRTHEQSKVVMTVHEHNELHANCPPIDVPSAHLARKVLALINNEPTSHTPLDTVKMLSEELYDDAEDYSDFLHRQIPFIQVSIDALKRRML